MPPQWTLYTLSDDHPIRSPLSAALRNAVVDSRNRTREEYQSATQSRDSRNWNTIRRLGGQCNENETSQVRMLTHVTRCIAIALAAAVSSCRQCRRRRPGLPVEADQAPRSSCAGSTATSFRVSRRRSSAKRSGNPSSSRTGPVQAAPSRWRSSRARRRTAIRSRSRRRARWCSTRRSTPIPDTTRPRTSRRSRSSAACRT